MGTRLERLGGRGQLARVGLALTLMAAAAGWIGVAAAGSAIAQSKKPAPPKPGECVAHSTEASFASVGYDHLVHLTNNCKRRAVCTVKTDVNPEPATVELAPGERQTVVTWRGSPAREFKADVSCREK